MDPQLAGLIEQTVNTRAKLDVLNYFHHNPYTWESLRGLAQRLHRLPGDLKEALQELARDGLLDVSSGRGGGGELVYSYRRQTALAEKIRLLMQEYEGPDGREIMAAIIAADAATRLRDLQRKRNLEDVKTRFIAMVTHELRTPVTVIRSVLTTLQADRSQSEEERLQLLQRAVRQSERLSSIIENLLVLSGLQSSGDLELYLSEVDVRRVVMDAAVEWRDSELAEMLHFDLEDAPVVVEADEYLLGEVLRELIANAFKFSPDGGTITVLAEEREGELFVSVDDTGQGLPISHRDNIFDVFYQAEEDSSRSLGGLGLGLYMIKRIIEAHHGRIWVQSKPGPGTRLCFTVPLIQPVN